MTKKRAWRQDCQQRRQICRQRDKLAGQITAAEAGLMYFSQEKAYIWGVA
jgi:hypothetical protein